MVIHQQAELDTSSRSTTSRRAFVAGAATLALGFRRPARAASGEEITQTAAFGIDPERADEARAALATLVEAVEANEPGVLAYVAHFAQEDPSKVFFFEVYADEKTLEAHGQQPHLAELGKAFESGLFRPPVEIVKYDRIGGVMR